MKVSDRDQTSNIVQQYSVKNTANAETEKKVQESVQHKLVPEEKVNLSSEAKEIQKLRQAVDALPDVRTDKVDEIKSRIDQGTYKVNGDDIAEKMTGESLLDIIA